MVLVKETMTVTNELKEINKSTEGDDFIIEEMITIMKEMLILMECYTEMKEMLH